MKPLPHILLTLLLLAATVDAVPPKAVQEKDREQKKEMKIKKDEMQTQPVTRPRPTGKAETVKKQQLRLKAR